jgi:putative aldouronate transport system substrate-binding protein
MSKEARDTNESKDFNRRRFIKLAAQAAVVIPAGSVILAACGDSTATQAVSTTAAPAATTAAPAATTAAASATTAAGATTTAAATTAAPAATTAAAATTSGAVTTAAASLPPVELTYTYRGTPPKELQLVQDALNKLTQAKINATVKLVSIDPGSFDQKVKLAFAAGEKMDLIFTAPWTNDYYQNVSQGNLLPIDDLLTKYAPKTYASMTPASWNAARVNGKIYAILNQQIWVKPWGVNIRKDIVDKYQIDMASLNKFEDLEPVMAKILAGEKNPPISSDDQGGGAVYRPEYYGYDSILDAVLIGMKADDKDLKIINQAATPEYKAAAELARKWYQEGYYPKDAPPTADATANFKAGKSALYLHIDKPGGTIEAKAKYGFDFVAKSFTKPILTTAGTTATLTGISRTSANPERAMMFAELLNTDKEIYNLICKGVEGKHWVWVDKAKEVIGFPPGLTAQTSGYNPNTDWMFGDQFNAYYVDESQVGNWEKTAELNKNSTPSLALGFAANTDKVKTEVAQVSALVKQYSIPLTGGRLDPATGIPEFLGKLKDAGMDRIIAEVQTQINAWKKANG